MYRKCLWLCLSMFAPVAFADEPVAGEFQVIDGAGLTGLMLNLALVLVIIAGCGWLLSRGQKRIAGAGDTMTVIASKALGNRERIMVIAIGDEQIVIGVTAHTINHLHTLAEPVSTDTVPAAERLFAEKLRHWMTRPGRSA